MDFLSKRKPEPEPQEPQMPEPQPAIPPIQEQQGGVNIDELEQKLVELSERIQAEKRKKAEIELQSMPYQEYSGDVRLMILNEVRAIRKLLEGHN